MTVLVQLRAGGDPVELAAGQGATIPEVVASLTRGSLTGSAVPLADAELELADGRRVRYADVAQFVEERAF